MNPNAPGVVFDCNVYLQAMISPNGPATRCLDLARQGELRVLVTDYVLAEIRDLPNDQKVAAKFRLTVEKAERFAVGLINFTEHQAAPPEVHKHPFDADDSHYVNLAIGSKTNLIVSRDRHLLNLMDVTRPEGHDFHRRFPAVRVLEPVAFLRWVEAEMAKAKRPPRGRKQ
jgi:putative PIN family toxin of toxin-antitoxin system